MATETQPLAYLKGEINHMVYTNHCLIKQRCAELCLKGATLIIRFVAETVPVVQHLRERLCEFSRLSKGGGVVFEEWELHMLLLKAPAFYISRPPSAKLLIPQDIMLFL